MSQYNFGAGFLYVTPPLEDGETIATPVMLGTLQECSIEFTGNIKELFGSNQFAEAVARGTQKITGKAKFAKINANTYNKIYFNEKIELGGLFAYHNEEIKTSASSEFTPINVKTGFIWKEDLGLISKATGEPMTRTTLSSPTGDLYKIDEATGLYKLSNANAEKDFYVSYMVESTGTAGKVMEIGNKAMGSAKTFRTIFNGRFNDKQITLILNACMSSKLGMLGTKTEDFSIADFEFSAMVDDYGVVGTLSTLE